MNPLEFSTLTIPAGTVTKPGVVKSPYAGALLVIISATTPFTMQFDANSIFQAQGGYSFSGKAVGDDGFKSITFFNPSAYPITVIFYVGQIGVSYIGSSLFKVAPTYMKGSSFINATNPVPSGSNISIPTGDKGHTRKGIIFTCPSSSGAAGVNIMDLNGNWLFQVVKNNPPTYIETDDAFLATSSSGSFGLGGSTNADLVIGEIYYRN